MTLIKSVFAPSGAPYVEQPMKIRHIAAGCVGLGAVVTPILFLVGTNSTFCPTLGRALTDEELIESVITQKAVGDFQLFFGDEEEQSIPPQVVDRFDTVDEFLAAYPTCCEVYRSGKAGFEPTFDFLRWIKGEVWPVVGVTYPKIVISESLDVQTNIVREYFETDPCGKLVEIV